METQPAKENKSSKLDKLVKISVIFGALIIIPAIAYYLVISLPQKERIEIKEQKQEQISEMQSQIDELQNQLIGQKQNDSTLNNNDSNDENEIQNDNLNENERIDCRMKINQINECIRVHEKLYNYDLEVEDKEYEECLDKVKEGTITSKEPCEYIKDSYEQDKEEHLQEKEKCQKQLDEIRIQCENYL